MVDLAASLTTIALGSSPLMRALRAARAIELPSWCVAGGVIRSLVWDHLHGHSPSELTGDVDLVYFDADSPPQRDREIERELRSAPAALDWDVANQAHVHQWYEREFGLPAAPLRSVEEGIATWPEYATCVGLRLGADERLQVIAPHGLADLFMLRVRHNPARASRAVFVRRHTEKRWGERWSRLGFEV